MNTGVHALRVAPKDVKISTKFLAFTRVPLYCHATIVRRCCVVIAMYMFTTVGCAMNNLAVDMRIAWKKEIY